MATAADVLAERLARLSEAMENANRTWFEAQLASSPTGRSIEVRRTGAQMRAAEQVSLTSAAEARSQTAYLQTPQGWQRQQSAIAAGARQTTAQAGLQAQGAQAQASFLQTPQGQQQLQAQYGAGLQRTTAQAQTGAAQASAQTAYLQTPQGWQQYQQQLQAQAQQRAAEEDAARQKQIVQFGRLNVEVGRAREVFAGMNPYIDAAKAAFSTMVYLAGKASPNTGATYAGSIDLAQAKVGSLFVAAVDDVSLAIQSFVDFLPDKQSKTGKFLSDFARAGVAFFTPWTDPDEEDKADAKKKMLRSMQGLPPAEIGSAEDTQTRTQLAVLQTGERSIEAELLRVQVQNLEENGRLLKQIESNTAGGSGAIPAFR